MVQIKRYPRNKDSTPMTIMAGVITDSSGNGGQRLTDVVSGPDGAPIDVKALILLDQYGAPIDLSGGSVSIPGPRGNSVLSGPDAPTLADGVNGDFWIARTSTTATLYGPKTDAGWGAGILLTGGSSGGGTGGGGTGGGGGTSGGTLNPALSAPILIDRSAAGAIQFDIGLGIDYEVGDTVYLVAKDKLGNILLTFSNTIDAAEATDTSAGTQGKAVFTGLSSVSLVTTYRWSGYVVKAGGATYGPSSLTIITGLDDIAPVLTAPTKASVGATTAILGVTTDTGEGRIWLVVCSANTQPSSTQIKAGQDSTGAGAVFASTINPVTSAGIQTINASGFTVGNTYYPFWLHRDAAGNETVLPGLSFTNVTTSGWAATTGYTLTNGGQTASPNNNGGGNSDILGTGVVNSGVKTIIMTCDFAAGLACDPGLKDIGSGVSMIWKADGSAAFPYTWNGPNPRHAALKLVCDFTARTVGAYIDGVLKGTVAMPTGFNNVRAVGNMQYGTTPYITLDTTDWA